MTRQIRRREFIGGALGATAGLVLAACTPSATATPSATVVASLGPRKPTGTLTVATSILGTAGYIPSRQANAEQSLAFGTFAETLIERKQDRSLGPRLARSWSISPDGLTYTFDLRTDVKWHDGSPFTSDDVKFTIEQAARPDSTSVRASQMRTVASVDTPSPDRVVVHLKKPDYFFLFNVTGPGQASAAIFSKKYITAVGDDAAAAKPIGTGPWQFAEFRPAELVRFTAVENHWRQTPAFQELIVRQVPEETTRLAMLLRGEADLAQISLANLKQLQSAGLPVFIQQNAYCLLISLQGQVLPTRPTFNKNVPWAADPADTTAWERARKVREAMDVAIDRKTIIATILAGQGAPAAYGFAGPGSPFDEPSYKPIAYDPVRAKQLLTDAGYASGFDFPLLLVEANGRPLAPEVGQAVAQYWQAIGLRPKQQTADFTATVRAQTAARSIPGSAVTFGNITYDEPVIGHVGNFATSADTLFGAEYPPLDALIEKATQTFDPAARKAIEAQIGQLCLDNHFEIVTAWVHALVAGSKKVKNLPQVNGVTILHNMEYAEPA